MALRTLARVVSAAALAACGTEGSEAPAPMGAPGSVERVALQAADVPGGMVRCPFSAEIGQYLENIRPMSPNGVTSIAATWEQFRAAGAVEGWITVFASNVGTCRAWVADEPPVHVHGGSRVMSSVVMRFPDPATAEAAYRADIFKQSNLRQASHLRVAEGAATGLGPNAIVGSDERGSMPLHQAVWQNGTFNVFLVARSVSSDDVHAAVRAEHARMADPASESAPATTGG